jgi:hypothetical protein
MPELTDGVGHFAAFDRSRNFADKAVRSLCYAPFTSLYFVPAAASERMSP